jgi:hypothetical protein
MCVQAVEITSDFRTKVSESCSELQKVTVPRALAVVVLHNVLLVYGAPDTETKIVLSY